MHVIIKTLDVEHQRKWRFIDFSKTNKTWGNNSENACKHNDMQVVQNAVNLLTNKSQINSQ